MIGGYARSRQSTFTQHRAEGGTANASLNLMSSGFLTGVGRIFCKKALTQGGIAVIKGNLHQEFSKTIVNAAQFIAVSLLQSPRNTVVSISASANQERTSSPLSSTIFSNFNAIGDSQRKIEIELHRGSLAIRSPRLRRRLRPAHRHRSARRSRIQALLRSTFFNGKRRTRLPVAAKMALSTAGAATAMVGSPMPPQKPPDGMMMVSTSGISSISMDG